MRTSAREQVLHAEQLSRAGSSPPLVFSWAPERSVPEWGIACALFAFSVLYLWSFRDYTMFNADEGVILQGAQRVLRGQLPYRDFFSFYTPGSYYLWAAILKLGGSSILAARSVLTVYAGLFSVLTYFVARRTSSRVLSIFSVYLLLVSCVPFRFAVLHNWDSTVSALAALYSALGLLRNRNGTWAFATGFFISLTIMLEQSKGAGVLLGIFVALAALGVTGSYQISRRQLVAGAIGVGLPIGIVFGYFGYQHSLAAMISSWAWPLRHYSVANHVPYGYHASSLDEWKSLVSSASWGTRFLLLLTLSPPMLILTLPVVSLGFSGRHFYLLYKMKNSTDASPFIVLMGGALLGLMLATFATGRPDLNRVTHLAPLFFVFIPLLLGGHGLYLPTLMKARPLVVVYLLLTFTAFGLALRSVPTHATVKVQTLRGVLRTDNIEELLPYVQSHIASRQTVLIHPYQPLYSFLTGTFSPTRYDYLQPGMHTSAQFQEALREFVMDRTRVVLLDISFLDQKVPTSWPATPAEVLARDPVSDYILAHYRPCKVLNSGGWRYLYMMRQDLSCPEEPSK